MSRLGLLLFVFGLTPYAVLGQSAPDSGDVVINEIMYAPSPSTNEFVELYNASEEPVNLNRLEYADDNLDFDPVVTSDTLLDPDTYVVLVRTPSEFSAAFPAVDFVESGGWDALNNGGDTVVLRDGPTATTLDAVPYTPSWGGDDGRSLERIDPAGPSDEATNFGPSEAETGGTPAAENSIFAPDRTPPSLDQVRPTPSGDSLRADFSEPLEAATVAASAFTVSGPTSPIVASAGLSDTSSSTVVCVLGSALSTGEYTLTASGIADRRANVRDETDAAFDYFVPEDPEAGDVVITELMYAPVTASNEFIEVYNRSDKIIDLGTLAYADDNVSFSPIAPRLSALPPDTRAVLVRDANAFEQAFPGVPYYAPEGWEALNNGGDTGFLRHQPTGTVLDSVPYDASWGGDGGRSLERIDPAGPSDAAANFGSSVAVAGATPAAENSIFDPDTTPPSLETAQPTLSGDSLLATFSEPIDITSVPPAAMDLSGPDAPSVVTTALTDTSASTVLCVLDRRLSTGEYTLIASGVTDRRENVQNETRAGFEYLVPDEPASGDVVITELLYAPTPPSNEFIEIYNRSNKTIDVGALAYAEDDLSFVSVAPRLTALPPESYAVLVGDPDAFDAAFPDVPYHTPENWNALNNGGDAVILQHEPTGTTLDSVPYDASWGGNGGRSLERIDPAGPSDAASNFGTSNASDGATPGRQNSIHNPDKRPPRPLFAEQIGDARVRVFFTEPLTPSSLSPDAFQIRGRQIDTVERPRDSVVVLSLDGPPSSSTLHVEGVQDRVGNEVGPQSMVLAHRPETEDMVINEILFDPRADEYDDRPDQIEYVELLNLTSRPLTLHDLFATDEPTEAGVADTQRVRGRSVLFPNGYAVVAAAPTGLSPYESPLVSAFPQAALAADSVAYAPVPGSRLGLDNDGDRLRVHRADGTTIASVDYDPDWHAAGLADPKGTALERMSPTGRADAPDNWTSSPAPAGGTPGAQNAIALAPPDDADEPGLYVEPSPFSVERDGATRIRYTVEEVPSLVRARIFDARGRHVRTLEDARLTGRSGELIWNGRDDDHRRVRIGVYVVLFEAVHAEAGSVTTFKEPVVVARPLQ